jgi:RNA polymerase sigma factor (sigma-70 family)
MPPAALTRTAESVTGEQAGAKSADSLTQEAFAAVVQRHSGMVLGVCRRMLASADAEDAAQAVFVLFWQKALRMREESQIAAWLHRTAQHVCRNARRSRASRVKYEQQAATESPALSSDSADQVHWREMRAILDEEINRLPEKLRIPFVLFHCENRSLKEVADLLGSTVSTVGTWLRHSREKLADGLSRRGIAVGAASLTALLSQHLVAEAASAGFVAATLQAASGVSTVGLAACTPTVATLVKAGTVGGWSKTLWIALGLGAAAIGFPLVVVWLLPTLQTRFSPDFPLLQGQWREVASERDGGPVSAVAPIDYVGTLQISGRNFHRFQTLADGRVLKGDRGSFVLDSSQSPRAIDFRLWVGTAYGVYELDGDALTLCVTSGGGARPDGLTTAKNDERILSRFKRVR